MLYCRSPARLRSGKRYTTSASPPLTGLLGTLSLRRRLPSRGHPPRPPGVRLHSRLAGVLPAGLHSALRAAPGLFRRARAVIRAAVCVLGGGPAGSAIALRLAQLGHAAVLVEKSPFPRPHIGESLAPDILAILETLGIRGEVEARGFLRPDAAIVRWGGESAIRPASGDRGFQVDRASFDLLLLRAVAAAGAIVQQPFAARALERTSDGGWLVHGRNESIETDRANVG